VLISFLKHLSTSVQINRFFPPHFLELIKEHLSEIHPNEIGFICEIKPNFDVETKTPLPAEASLRDLINEKSDEMKNIKVKFMDEARKFYERNLEENNVLTKAEKAAKAKAEEDNVEAGEKEKKKPMLVIGESYSMAQE
jgi:hypothetical protein